ncbi:glycerophosphodiester phosphodiesterase GDPDL4-like [Andrographis paniculata]|uniref:glycerophosphodiester phosphodiesterase GDPDL4-like n=1 Tax=Andrographis paniculata TaxID=175694 RepID=UPI0021E7BAF8|nr:glycerophosphodiester phosphodiesterase GDPDL4-like [Andrographis paniculata]
MWKLHRSLCMISLLLLCSSATAKGSRGRGRNWLTLSGEPPIVIARGGFSGVFADSSEYAYRLAQLYAPNSQALCNVQLTKDGIGVCLADIKLDNASNINVIYSDRNSSYNVNGEQVIGWFSVDFTLDELALVNLQQNIYSRAPYFDGTPMPILTVKDVVSLKPHGLWLNIPYDEFFKQHNLSMSSFIVSASKSYTISYISSPEVGFLRSIGPRLRTGRTKLVFQVPRGDITEPSTKQTYDTLLLNLTFIKSFASGILVPKTYIWPLDSSYYLQGHTAFVTDAHKAGLEVFASNFANDASVIPYNYSYDPVNEYLSFIDNSQFSVDGVLSDFPLTPSAAIDCFSHMNKNDPIQAKFLIISSEGASGDLPSCTDMAYIKAVSDGVDILDCPVQVTSDGIPFCLGSIDLRQKTENAAMQFSNRIATNTDLNIKNGVFTYNLTWSEIQSLKPGMTNPYTNYNLFRNPKAVGGSFLPLSEFLSFASNASSVSGVLISIENAAYLAENQGLGVTDIVLDTLNKAGYNNRTTRRTMIKSSESAVLKKIKSSSSNYELVYEVDKNIRDISNDTILAIKTFASAVVVSKNSVFSSDGGILTSDTKVVPKLHDFKLPVYVSTFRNEYVSQAWDYFSDPYMEINTHVNYMEVDGVITEYPATASRFRRNRCLGYKTKPNYMTPVQPGGLLPFITKSSMPPAEAPEPVWTESDLAEAPLPPVRKRLPTLDTSNSSTSPALNSPNGQSRLVASSIFAIISTVCSAILL